MNLVGVGRNIVISRIVPLPYNYLVHNFEKATVNMFMTITNLENITVDVCNSSARIALAPLNYRDKTSTFCSRILRS